MNRKNKIMLLSLGFGTLVVLALLIIPHLYNNKAGVLGKKQEEVKNNATKAASNTALKTENTIEKPMVSNTSTKVEETNNMKTVISEKIKKDINALIKEYYGNTEKLEEEVLATTKKQEAKKAVESITEKREGIERYNDVKTIIKAGLEEETYFVFTTYNMKFFNIETEAPGMSVAYVVTDKSGALAIEQDTSAPNLQIYINKLSQEKDIKSEIERVNKELASATKEDETLKDFIDQLQKASK